MRNIKNFLSVLLAMALVLSFFSGCKSSVEPEEISSSSLVSSSSSSSSKPADPDAKTVATALTDFLPVVAEKKAANSDTVGWLHIPEIAIDDVVVCNYESNQFYYRLNFEKQYDFNGIFYADKRSVFGDGSSGQIGVNTCIYGHSMTDDKDAQKYSIKFGPLHDFRDPEIAKKTPYIFFSTEKENLAFEVFAVFVANNDNPDVPYNRNDIPPDDFRKMVKEEILKRSIYNYDVELTDTDKFITLSTCIYVLPNGQRTGYPNTYYRYAIMGRLVSPDAPLKTEAVFTLNPNPYLDPDGKIGSK